MKCFDLRRPPIDLQYIIHGADRIYKRKFTNFSFFLGLAVNAESAVYEGNICYAVNIDIITGESVSDDAIYGSLGLSYMDYLALTEKALLNRFVTPFASSPLPDSMIAGERLYCANGKRRESQKRDAVFGQRGKVVDLGKNLPACWRGTE